MLKNHLNCYPVIYSLNRPERKRTKIKCKIAAGPDGIVIKRLVALEILNEISDTSDISGDFRRSIFL